MRWILVDAGCNIDIPLVLALSTGDPGLNCPERGIVGTRVGIISGLGHEYPVCNFSIDAIAVKILSPEVGKVRLGRRRAFAAIVGDAIYVLPTIVTYQGAHRRRPARITHWRSIGSLQREAGKIAGATMVYRAVLPWRS